MFVHMYMYMCTYKNNCSHVVSTLRMGMEFQPEVCKFSRASQVLVEVSNCSRAPRTLFSDHRHPGTCIGKHPAATRYD